MAWPFPDEAHGVLAIAAGLFARDHPARMVGRMAAGSTPAAQAMVHSAMPFPHGDWAPPVGTMAHHRTRRVTGRLRGCGSAHAKGHQEHRDEKQELCEESLPRFCNSSLSHPHHPQRHADHHQVFGQRDEAERHIARAADAGAFEFALVD